MDQHILDKSHVALMKSSMSNVSTTTRSESFCGTPYGECLCSAQSTKNISLADCLTDRFLLGNRLSLLFAFVIEICFIRELFTITGKYSRLIVKGLWIAAVFILFIIGKGIYQSSCFHRGLNMFLYVTGGTLFFLMVRGILHDQDTACYSSKNYVAIHRDDIIEVEIIDDETSEDVTNDSVLWKDLL